MHIKKELGFLLDLICRVRDYKNMAAGPHYGTLLLTGSKNTLLLTGSIR
uniref:NR LBD domain-containing protein n=1 Tax=Steinernema glaseri TaxID=37863 RepID=A0A1I8AND5_9BILA